VLRVLSRWFAFSKIVERRLVSDAVNPTSESLEESGRSTIRRYQLQVFAPDWGGWHTVMTAAEDASLGVPTRLLSWQTGKRLRVVDPDGRIVREIGPSAAGAAHPAST
jgi:hypothetical protein